MGMELFFCREFSRLGNVTRFPTTSLSCVSICIRNGLINLPLSNSPTTPTGLWTGADVPQKISYRYHKNLWAVSSVCELDQSLARPRPIHIYIPSALL